MYGMSARLFLLEDSSSFSSSLSLLNKAIPVVGLGLLGQKLCLQFQDLSPHLIELSLVLASATTTALLMQLS